MKLLIFCPYYPPHVGGLESHADEFNEHMAKEGYDITVFTPRIPFDAPEREVLYERVRIIRFPAFEIIPNYPLPKIWSPVFWKQAREIWKEQYDIVLSRTRFFSTSMIALIYAKTQRTPWVHIEHGSDFVQLHNPVFKFLARIYDYTLGNIVLRSAHGIVANSQASAVFVKKLAPKSNPTVIYRGVSLSDIENIPVSHAHMQHPAITYVGRLIDGKGVHDLIRAAQKIDSITLCIVGDGPQKNSLERLAKKLNIRAVFLGNKSFEEVVSIMKMSDVVVNPSYTEGLPTSIIEAALCKKTIVATNVGGTNEIISDAISGYLIPPKHPDILAKKIEALINNPNTARTFGNAAYEHAKKRFTWDANIPKYMQYLDRYVSSR